MDNPEHFSLFLMEALGDPQVKEQLKKSMDLDFITNAVASRLDNKLKHIDSKLKQKDDEIKALQKANKELQQKYDELEQYSRKNCLKIEGIEERPNENTFEVVVDLSRSMSLDPPIEITDIDNCHRVGSVRDDGKPRPIIAKFNSYRDRKRLYDSRKVLYGHNKFVRAPEPQAEAAAEGDHTTDPATEAAIESAPPQPSSDGRRPGSRATPSRRNQPDPASSDHTLPTQSDHTAVATTDSEHLPDRPDFTLVTKWKIFINEALSKTRSKIAYEARRLKDKNKITDTWTVDGRIKVKNNYNRIMTIESLDGLLQFA